MSDSSHRCLLMMLSLIAASAVSPRAQSNNQLPVVVEKIEVVATKAPESPNDVPVSVEVIDGDEIRRRGATDLSSALALMTGIDIAAGGDQGPAASVPAFWGLREFDAFLLVVDDVPWGGAFNPALATVDLHDVERIEVLRGPAPVSYGATSFVGVIHVVHKTPSTSSMSVVTRASSYGSADGSAVLASVLGRWQSRFSVDGERRRFSDERTAFDRAHVLWQVSRSSTSTRQWFAVDALVLDQSPASPHVRVGSQLTPAIPLDANHNPDDAHLTDRRIGGRFGLERTRGARVWTTQASLAWTDQDVLRGFLTSADDIGLNARGFKQVIDLTDVYADTHAVWQNGQAWRSVLGADYLHGGASATGGAFAYHAPLDGSSVPVVPGTVPLDVRMIVRRDFAGAYGAVEWNPAKRLRVDLGVRLNATSEEREQGDEAAGGGNDTQNHVRPGASAGVIWSAWDRGPDHGRIFANVRDTFKPAAIDFAIADEEEGVLKPETARSYEVGLKSRALDGRVDFSASAFLMDFANLVIGRTINGLPGLTNAGTQRFKGFELGSTWLPGRQVIARATYSHHDARFRDYVFEFDGVPTQLAGKLLEMSPRSIGSAGVLLAPAKGVTAHFDLSVIGDRFLNKRNTALAPAYAAFSAGVGYRKNRWELRLDGWNLSDRRPPVAESELGDAQYYRLEGRRITASFSAGVGP